MLFSKRNKLILATCVLLIIITILIITLNLIMNQTDKIVALVNSEPILQSQLDKVLKQDKSIDSAELLENTIDDILLMQYAKNNGCTVTKQEVDDLILEYKEEYSVFFEEALKVYTEAELREGLGNRILINKGKEFYLLKYPVDTETGFDEYLRSYDIELSVISEEQLETAKQKYKEKQEQNALVHLFEELRGISHIEYK